MPEPKRILEDAFKRATDAVNADPKVPLLQIAGEPTVIEQTQKRLALIARSKNRAAIRLVMVCALAKAHKPAVDIRQPYTEIGGTQSFSGRGTYDEPVLGPFLLGKKLPVNRTTAFLTPVLRNLSAPLLRDTVLLGSPKNVYVAALELLDDAANGKFSAEDLLTECMRWLIIVGEEHRKKLAELLESVQRTISEGGMPLSAEEIVTLVSQHLASPNSSRLPVLVVAAAYAAGGAKFGETTRPLESHNAADSQTGSVGDIEVTLVGENDVIAGYEMKTKRVTTEDIDSALVKVGPRRSVQNYVFITTETIEPEVNEYATALYSKTGVEIVVLDCVSFLRHFLHLFHRSRLNFVEAYQKLVIEEPESSVGQELKETWLTLRRASESRTDEEADESSE